jgi:hypothetical protein
VHIRFAFKRLVGLLPLVGPHAGEEVKLLLSGTKPIGVFLYKDYTRCPEEQSFREFILSEIAPLNEACQRGHLSSITQYQAAAPQSDGHDVFVLFCQPGLEQKMNELGQFLASPATRRLSAGEIGIYLGYSPSDIWLFERGGYDTLPHGLSWLAKMTHQYRKRCRIEAELGGSEIEPPGVKVDHLSL